MKTSTVPNSTISYKVVSNFDIATLNANLVKYVNLPNYDPSVTDLINAIAHDVNDIQALQSIYDSSVSAASSKSK